MLAHPALFCKRPQDNVTRNLSFYGAFAFDIFTDLAIMALPIKLLWYLQISLRRKLSVGVIFVMAGLCMIAAIVRLIQINSKTGSKNPSNIWLAVWGSTEATVAMIVGSLPTFASHWHQTNGASLNYGSASPQKNSKLRSQSIPLGTVGAKEENKILTTAWKGSSSSQEELSPATGIRVTTDYQIQEERPKPDTTIPPTNGYISPSEKPHHLHPSKSFQSLSASHNV
ncbi:MAG: hypothetical protein M1836_003064 [Candelina mexicana]|nr:MAG: hypothetical protein M1836_003064 [Candelina mexicana]